MGNPGKIESARRGAAKSEPDKGSAYEPDTPNVPKPKWRPSGWQLLFGVLVVVGVSLYVSYIVWRAGVENDLQAAISDAYALGEPVWFSDLEPERVPEGQNGRDEWIRAHQLLQAHFKQSQKLHQETNGARSSDYFDFLVANAKGANRRSLVRGEFSKLTASEFELLRGALTETVEPRKLMERAFDYPHIQLEYDWQTTRPSEVRLPTHQQSIEFGDLFSAQLAMALHDGRLDDAVLAAKRKLRLGRVFADEPLMTAAGVRFRNIQDALRGLQELLSAATLPPEHVEEIDQLLAELESGVRLRDMVLADRAMYMSTASNPPNHPEFFPEDADTWTSWQHAAYRRSGAVVMRDQTRLLQISREVAELIDEPGPNAGRAMAALEFEQENMSGWYVVAPMRRDSVARRIAGLTIRQRLMNARLALRVARYKEAHGRLPKSLEKVLDGEMPEVPVGLLSGKPVVYRRQTENGTETGFVIYDVGEDMSDHGGTTDVQEVNSSFTVRFRDASVVADEGQ